MEPPAPAVPGHPCDRCGAFAVLSAGVGGRYCEPCLVKLRHPVQGDPLTVGGILGGVWMLLKAVGVRAVAVIAIFALPGVAAQVAWPNHLILITYAKGAVGVVSLAAVLGLARAAIATDRRPSIAVAVTDGLRHYWPLLGVEIVIGLGRSLGLWLLVFPGLYLYFSFWLATPIVLNEGLRAAEALGASYDRMKGRRLAAAGAYLLAMIPITIGLVPILLPRIAWKLHHRGQHPHFDINLLHVWLYLALRIFSVLTILVLAVVYEKTRPEVRPPSVPPVDADGDGITELTPEELEALTGPLPPGD